MPARMITTVVAPMATITDIQQGRAEQARDPMAMQQATIGDPTAATTAATITGTTITEVSVISQTDPTGNNAIPTSSHAIRPMSRSRWGTEKIPVSWLGSISSM